MIDPQSDAVWGGDGPNATRTNSDESAEEFFSERALVEQETRVREFIQAHPVAVVCAAFAFGFVIARWLRED